MRQALEPIRILTVSQFAEMSETTIANYDAAVATNSAEKEKLRHRRFPLQAAADGVLVNEFRNRADALLNSAVLWDALVADSDKTMELNAFVFKLLSSLESGVEELHSEPNQQSPIAMFRSDGDAAWEQDMMDLPYCRTTQWHREHIQDSLQHGGLLAGIPKAKRDHIILETAMDIKRLESLHASFRRRTRMLGQQTHQVDWEMMVAQWVTDRARVANRIRNRILECYIDGYVVQPSTQCANENGNDDKRKRKRESQNSAGNRKTKQTRRRKAPGAFRIFTRDMTLKCKREGVKPPCLKTVSLQYWALPPDKHAKLQERAARAKKQNEKQEGKTKVLGMSSKETVRFAKKEKAIRLSQKMKSQQGDVIATLDQRTPFGQYRNAAQSALQTAMRDLNQHSTDIAEGFSICRTAASMVSRDAKEANELAIATWHRTDGRKGAQAMGKSLLLSSHATSNIIAMLGASLPSYVLCRDTKHIAACCKIIASKVNTDNFKKVLRTQFRQRCQPIMDKDIERIQETADEKPRRPCLKMMVCLCDEAGERLPSCVRCSRTNNQRCYFSPLSLVFNLKYLVFELPSLYFSLQSLVFCLQSLILSL